MSWSVPQGRHPGWPTQLGPLKVPAGVIEVRKPPSLPWKQTVQVVADKPTKVRADLQSTMNGGVGVVRVLSDAQGARAFITKPVKLFSKIFPLKPASVRRLYKYFVAFVFCNITCPRLSSALEIANASEGSESKNIFFTLMYSSKVL